MSALIEVRDLSKEFRVKGYHAPLVAIDEVTFDIEEGQTFGLIGESGSGKTTVGRCLLRLLPSTRGSMRFDQKDYARCGEREFLPIRMDMQMVFQDPYYSLNPRRTVWETVLGALGTKAAGRITTRKDAVQNALAKVRLDQEYYGKYPHQLSMGQQQRVGIARAIVSRPRFIVLDEPTSSLDISVRGEIIDLLAALQRDLGVTYLFISHDLSTVQYLCHRVAIMYLGQIVEMGPVQGIFHHHRHPYSVALLASVMHPDPRRKRNRYRLSGEIPSPINLPRACYLASRCPEAQDICRAESPPVVEVAPDHLVRCHFAREPRKILDAGPKDPASWAGAKV